AGWWKNLPAPLCLDSTLLDTSMRRRPAVSGGTRVTAPQPTSPAHLGRYFTPSIIASRCRPGEQFLQDLRVRRLGQEVVEPRRLGITLVLLLPVARQGNQPGRGGVRVSPHLAGHAEAVQAR